MNKPKNKKRTHEHTPIIDGDARPDQYPGEEKADLKNKSRSKHEKDITAERAGDVNSLEDFRDKK